MYNQPITMNAFGKEEAGALLDPSRWQTISSLIGLPCEIPLSLLKGHELTERMWVQDLFMQLVRDGQAEMKYMEFDVAPPDKFSDCRKVIHEPVFRKPQQCKLAIQPPAIVASFLSWARG
jgi:hypothetical protein